jgi:hypothetical protein
MDSYDMNFWRLYLRLLNYRLTARETNYLIWRFYNRKNWDEIARLDGRRIGRAAVSLIMNRAYRKIRLNNQKK